MVYSPKYWAGSSMFDSRYSLETSISNKECVIIFDNLPVLLSVKILCIFVTHFWCADLWFLNLNFRTNVWVWPYSLPIIKEILWIAIMYKTHCKQMGIAGITLAVSHFCANYKFSIIYIEIVHRLWGLSLNTSSVLRVDQWKFGHEHKTKYFGICLSYDLLSCRENKDWKNLRTKY